MEQVQIEKEQKLDYEDEIVIQQIHEIQSKTLHSFDDLVDGLDEECEEVDEIECEDEEAEDKVD